MPSPDCSSATISACAVGSFVDVTGAGLPGAPAVVAGAPHVFGIPIIFNVLAVMIVTVITIVLVWGIKESANFNNVIVILKVTIVFLVIGFGFMYVNSDNWHPFIPPNTGTFGEYGWRWRGRIRRQRRGRVPTR